VGIGTHILKLAFITVFVTWCLLFVNRVHSEPQHCPSLLGKMALISRLHWSVQPSMQVYSAANTF
jgi:hypothetical protein